MVPRDNIKSGKSYLLLVTGNKPIPDRLYSAIKNKTADIIFITFRLPYNQLQDTGKVKCFVIDCTSGGTIKNKEGEDYYVTSGPESLTELSIILNREVSRHTKMTLVFDSINYFLLNNSIASLKRLLHYLKNKLTSKNITLFFLYSEDENKNIVIPFMESLVDKII